MSEPGLERTLIIEHAMGLHARPAALFVRAAQRFKAQVEVWNGDRRADAKSILSVLSLGVNQGTRITLRADGPDAAEALDALCDLVANNFPEGVKS
jgi:phosphocarrier protein HPr